jgi:hypothetical protein
MAPDPSCGVSSVTRAEGRWRLIARVPLTAACGRDALSIQRLSYLPQRVRTGFCASSAS